MFYSRELQFRLTFLMCAFFFFILTDGLREALIKSEHEWPFPSVPGFASVGILSQSLKRCLSFDELSSRAMRLLNANFEHLL